MEKQGIPHLVVPNCTCAGFAARGLGVQAR